MDERAFEGFMVSMAPEPRIANLETGEVRKDRVSGETIWMVGVVAMRGRETSVEQIQVVGEPKGLRVGLPVRITGLEGAPWEREGRSGVSWRAASIVPLSDPVPGPAGPGGPGGPGGPAGAGRRTAGPGGGPGGPGGPGEGS